MLKKFVYLVVFWIGFTFAFFKLNGDTRLVTIYIENLRWLTTLCTAVFGSCILYVKNSLKDLPKIDKIRSSELNIVKNFSSYINKRIWLQLVFYAFVFVYGIILSLASFESPITAVIHLSIVSGLLLLELATLYNTYLIDNNIMNFLSEMQLRALKIKEKEEALKVLSADEEYSNEDIEYFKKMRNKIN
ncbi:hypothetical protein [Photobacterium leiognathi]|uniref:hypothetical protein n=1 Tax=Photobacterium leiognathi TaxID=553611 RepID=UPI0029812125|nr:hypothetical protein [Photobacterium leiognathi]